MKENSHSQLTEPALIPIKRLVVSQLSTRITVQSWTHFLSLINDYSPKQNGKPLVFVKRNKQTRTYTSPAVALEGGNCYLTFKKRSPTGRANPTKPAKPLSRNEPKTRPTLPKKRG